MRSCAFMCRCVVACVRSAHQALPHAWRTCCAGALEAVLRHHARVNRSGGPAAEVHHRGRWGGRRGGLRRLCSLRGLVALGRVGGDAVLGQELLQVHVLQLKVVPVVGQGLVPQGGPEEGRLWVAACAALIFQLFLFLLVFSEHCEGFKRTHTFNFGVNTEQPWSFMLKLKTRRSVTAR